MSKVVSSLLSGKYSQQTTSTQASVEAESTAPEGDKDHAKEKEEDATMEVVVAPRMFKHLIGQGHTEFSSGRQQDAAEYMQHLLEVCMYICVCVYHMCMHIDMLH